MEDPNSPAEIDQDDDYDPAQDDDVDDDEVEKKEKRKPKKKSPTKAKQPLKILQVVAEIPIEFDFTPPSKTSDTDPDDSTSSPNPEAGPPKKRARKMTTPQRSRTIEKKPQPQPVLPVGNVIGQDNNGTSEKDPLSFSNASNNDGNQVNNSKNTPTATINRFPCGYCDTVFTDVSFLERHHKRCKAKRAAESVGMNRMGAGPAPRPTPTVVNIPGVRQTYNCDQCSFTTKNPEHLKYHKPIHNDANFFSCDECKFSCRDLEQMNNHKKVHAGYKEFTYVQEYNTDQQEETVTNDQQEGDQEQEDQPQIMETIVSDDHDQEEKLYSCDQCSYTSSRPGYLVMHKRIHVQEKPYVCTDCGYKCSRLAYFKKHRATHTDAGNALACDRCSFSTASQNVLEAHKLCHKA